MNTNMTGFIWFSKNLGPYALDEGNLSIGRIIWLIWQNLFYFKLHTCATGFLFSIAYQFAV